MDKKPHHSDTHHQPNANNGTHLPQSTVGASSRTEFDRQTSPAGSEYSCYALLEAAYRFSLIANKVNDAESALREFVVAIKDVSGCMAVAIYIHHEGKWLAYNANSGFADGFCPDADIHLDPRHCFCTQVFHQQTDPALTFFTENGSFVINRTKSLLLEAKASVPYQTGDCCIKAGYQSVGLFPIRSLDRVLGIVHVADPCPDSLPPDLVRLLENGALQLGVGIEKIKAANAARASFEELASRGDGHAEQFKETAESLTVENQQRLLIEKELKQNRHLLQLVFESISDPLVLMDENAQVKMINQAAINYYGAETNSRTINLVCYQGLGRFNEACQTCLIPAALADGRAMEFERPGFIDQHRTEVVELFPVTDDFGSPKGAVMQIHDITAVRDAQKKVNDLQTQASIGMLVSSVAHEIKNPNSFIAFNISIMRAYINDLLPVLDAHAEANPAFEVAHLPFAEFREDVFKLMDTIEHGSKRIDFFLGNLKALGPNRPKAKCVRLRLAEVISRVTETVRSKIEKTVKTFDIQIARNLPDIYSDAGILEQVIINLLVNASQAADKGNATIRLKAELCQTDKARVLLIVEDNGHGMDEKTQRQIFEPFYSTKIAEGGTGLGLYVCRDLIKKINGRMKLESELGKGTRFTIELPTHASMCYIENNNKNEPKTIGPPPLEKSE